MCDPTYLYGDYTGDYSHEDAPRFYIMKGDSTTREQLDTAYNGVHHAIEDVYNEGYLPGYRILAYSTSHAVDCSNFCRPSPTYDCVDNNFSVDRGCWLWVTQCGDSFACAEGAWDNKRLAMVDALWNSGKELEAIAVQEAFHTYINNDCSKVMGMCDGVNGEHDLGTVIYRNSNYRYTAMTASYPDSADAGDCASTVDPSKFTPETTDCTEKGFKYSKEHANGQH